MPLKPSVNNKKTFKHTVLIMLFELISKLHTFYLWSRTDFFTAKMYMYTYTGMYIRVSVTFINFPKFR
jgi:hypothetical protein